jgi:23S rRNA pseudoU1915 N3-methylase RlmH
LIDFLPHFVERLKLLFSAMFHGQDVAVEIGGMEGVADELVPNCLSHLTNPHQPVVSSPT